MESPKTPNSGHSKDKNLNRIQKLKVAHVMTIRVQTSRKESGQIQTQIRKEEGNDKNPLREMKKSCNLWRLTLKQRVWSAKHLSGVKGKKHAPTARALYCFTVTDLVETTKWVITEKFKQTEKFWGIGRER